MSHMQRKLCPTLIHSEEFGTATSSTYPSKDHHAAVSTLPTHCRILSVGLKTYPIANTDLLGHRRVKTEVRVPLLAWGHSVARQISVQALRNGLEALHHRGVWCSDLVGNDTHLDVAVAAHKVERLAADADEGYLGNWACQCEKVL